MSGADATPANYGVCVNCNAVCGADSREELGGTGMGMFDNVVCDYPLPDDHNKLDGWQTKDTPAQFLLTYTITEDGRLLEPDMRTVTDAADPLGFHFEKTGETELPFDGDLYFYTSGWNDEWIEYRATFRKGHVTEMTRIPDRYTFPKDEASQ